MKASFFVVEPRPELVFGLVGPVGTSLSLVSEEIEKLLAGYGYHTILIRVSDLLHEISPELRALTDEYDRIDKHMDKGNDIRRTLARADALSLFSIAAIRGHRRKLTGDASKTKPNTAYLLRSLKTPQEIETLRRVYGSFFFPISVYGTKQHRMSAIARAIAKSRRETDDARFQTSALTLIQRDESELGMEFGQNVRMAFPEADVFISDSTRSDVNEQLKRFLEILFSYPYHTPTRDEYGMKIAKVASLRSADLSRQVGAAILTGDGSVVAMGCNEVPKSGGGQYWPGDQSDARDFRRGFDPNHDAKNAMLAEVLAVMKKHHKGDASRTDAPSTDAFEAVKLADFADTQLMSVLEFGRVVHAEMAAIAEAAKLGKSIEGGTLYCTTFPCHNCARHIIAAGIRRVVYVEPYPKSQAARLYPDSIAVDYAPGSGEMVVGFDPFIGVAPVRFTEFFRARRRKTPDGQTVDWKPTSAPIRIEQLYPSYTQIESTIVSDLGLALNAASLYSSLANATEGGSHAS